VKFDILDKCAYPARDHAAQVLGNQQGNRFFAAIWISMYSRLCHIEPRYLKYQDTKSTNFPFRMNKELRCAFHSLRDPTVKDLFRNASRMINEALGIMKPRRFTNLYRGLTTFPFAQNTYFIEDGFFSATVDLNVALRFAQGQILMVVEEMSGVYIAEYAEPRFKDQKEVLGLLRSTFKITKIVDDPGEIKEKFPSHTPQQVIYVIQATRNKKQRANLRRNQNALPGTISFCDPN